MLVEPRGCQRHVVRVELVQLVFSCMDGAAGQLTNGMFTLPMLADCQSGRTQWR